MTKREISKKRKDFFKMINNIEDIKDISFLTIDEQWKYRNMIDYKNKILKDGKDTRI